jgi:hypothetical protein
MRRPLVFRRRLPTMLLAGLLAGPLTCVSVQAASPDGDLRHRVVTGDTLQTLGERYLRAPARWRELQALNKLSDPQALVPGTIVRIPRRLLRPVGVATAKVEFVEGQPVGMTSGTAGGGAPASDEAGIPLAAGDAISEGTRIQVPKDGYLRLRLADGSVVRVLAESDVQLKRLRSKRTTGPYESVIDVRRGKVESDVAPQPKGRRFEIHAPGAVASVRGTRFDVTVAVDGRVSTSVAEGIVKVQPRQPKRRGTRSADVQAGQGAVVATDGQLDKRPTLPDAPDLSTRCASRATRPCRRWRATVCSRASACSSRRWTTATTCSACARSTPTGSPAPNPACPSASTHARCRRSTRRPHRARASSATPANSSAPTWWASPACTCRLPRGPTSHDR